MVTIGKEGGMAARKKSEEPSIDVDEVLTDEELKAVAEEDGEPAECKTKPENGPRTVVVAEDEAVNRMDLVAMLEDNGYEVVGQAANGDAQTGQQTGQKKAVKGFPDEHVLPGRSF